MNATAQPAAGRKEDLEKSLRLCIQDGLAAMPIVTMSLPVNVFITALVTKGWVLPKPAIGLLCAMPFAANFVQVFAVPYLSRLRPPKTLTVVTASLNLLCWFLLAALLEVVPRDQPNVAAAWFIGWFFVASIFAALAGVTWNAWIQEWVPSRLRGKYFGHRNRLLQISLLSFLLITGWVLAHWEYSVRAFQAVIVGSGLLRVASLYWQWVSPTQPHRHVEVPTLSFHAQLAVLRRSHSLLWFIAFGATWSFAANCFGPFYQVFMFEQLGFSAWDVGVLSTVSALGGALSLPAWGRLLDRYGNRPVMAVSLLVWQGVNVLWCTLTPSSNTLLYLIWALGGMTSMGAIASAGFVLGQFTILLRLIPLEAKSLAIGLNLAVTSLAAAIAPVIGGGVLSWALTRWTDAVAVYHACFLLQPVLATAGCLLLLRVHEPQASPLTMVFGAMRNIRTLSGVLGLDFLVNYVFYRPPKR
ncbi:MFS transporter [Opitutus sp. ER46]|uniref:MFS transporter n=1 Tax=Opitutus sp. ER46 TaxID=2161864 RepID=UPI001E33C4FD|nr:MFS transporter [Opitutus sp. ER46]